MRQLLLVGIGGFIGSVVRYLISTSLIKIHSTSFPWSTFIINIIGCFIIGLLFNSETLTNSKYYMNEFIIVGVLGGFTTFSAFGIETYNLFKNNLGHIAILYASCSILFGLIAIYISSKLM